MNPGWENESRNTDWHHNESRNTYTTETRTSASPLTQGADAETQMASLHCFRKKKGKIFTGGRIAFKGFIVNSSLIRCGSADLFGFSSVLFLCRSYCVVEKLCKSIHVVSYFQVNFKTPF
jgi:hypothetical protein